MKITLTIGDQSGEALLRRLENGPDERAIFRKALQEAAGNAGAAITFEPGLVHLEISGAGPA